VDQNETTYMPEKSNQSKDDQVLLAAPPMQPKMVTAVPAAIISAPAKMDIGNTASVADFVGAWEDAAKSVCIVSDSTLRWPNNVISKITVSGGLLQLQDFDTTATLDGAKNTLTWSDGDVWKRTVVPTEFAGMWLDDAKGVHTIVGTTLKWTNGTISDVTFSGGQLRLEENQLTASLDSTKTKLAWSDGDTWTRTDNSANSSEFVGTWKDAEEKLHTITDTTLNWSNTRCSIIKVGNGQLTVDDCGGISATLEGPLKLVWSDGDVWMRSSA